MSVEVEPSRLVLVARRHGENANLLSSNRRSEGSEKGSNVARVFEYRPLGNSAVHVVMPCTGKILAFRSCHGMSSLIALCLRNDAGSRPRGRGKWKSAAENVATAPLRDDDTRAVPRVKENRLT